MLQLKTVTKRYCTGGLVQMALNQISLNFRKNEFVSILGPSGSGKTTLLNIIGGLDRCDGGELLIDGRTTRMYKDRDWDYYRNHSIGFVFQGYHLIGHQTVLANVELALSISGISKKERRKRAENALREVGLGDHLRKRPNQLSGGQMQRVAIARALVNDPAILLADEPTGALDSHTSEQVMELLKEVAKERLVIMVTHNAELAEAYSTRIIRLHDGQVVGDSNPYEPAAAEETAAFPIPEGKKPGRTSMSFATSLALSFQNLRTKKGRTILTSFAGSIGIIGIALILALSTGVNSYMTNLQKDTMSSYPIEIEAQTVDMNGMVAGAFYEQEEKEHDPNRIYSSGESLEVLSQINGSIRENNLKDFRKWLMEEDNPIREHLGETGIVYSYPTPFHAYAYDPDGQLVNLDGSGLGIPGTSQELSMGQAAEDAGISMEMGSGMEIGNLFTELIPGNGEASISTGITKNYELAYGDWPKDAGEVVLILDRKNEIPLQNLYALGLLPSKDYPALINAAQKDAAFRAETYDWSYEELCSRTFYLIPECDLYTEEDNGLFSRTDENSADVQKLIPEAFKLRVAGIIRPKEDADEQTLNGTIGYISGLNDYLISYAKESRVVQAQLSEKEKNVLTGMELDEESRKMLLNSFGYSDPEEPSSIRIYMDSFNDKEAVAGYIEDYNDSVPEESRVVYTDFVELLVSAATAIVDVISYVLIAFVAVSLIVSSLMIGIITYISVLERTKEIGILRALGASKRNISQVFNAETVIIGMCAGLLGVLITALFLLPVNAVIHFASGTNDISASLPVQDALILIALSVLLTFIGGLIPARKAAKKDPVAALRSE